MSKFDVINLTFNVYTFHGEMRTVGAVRSNFLWSTTDTDQGEHLISNLGAEPYALIINTSTELTGFEKKKYMGD